MIDIEAQLKEALDRLRRRIVHSHTAAQARALTFFIEVTGCPLTTAATLGAVQDTLRTYLS